MLKKKFHLLMFFALSAFVGCDTVDVIEPLDFEIDVAADSITFAVIGDYGDSGNDELMVSALVKSWNPDFIITTGDNNYPSGEDETLEENITDYYGDFIYNYDASEYDRCNGFAFQDKVNRFFPSPGNHDDNSFSGLRPYQNYFTLPGNELYYKFYWGDAAFYSLNSTATLLSDQKEWLEKEMSLSQKKFNIVYFHHSPYSDADHGNSLQMQWDFHSLGVDVVLTGHDHVYSRIEKYDEPGLTYIINGAGGRSLYTCGKNPLNQEEFSVFCFDDNYGAIKGRVNGEQLILEFFSVDSQNEPTDQFVLSSK